MKPSRFAVDFSVGFVLFVATVVVILGLFIVGSGTTVFGRHIEYRVRLPAATGLVNGSWVFLSGVHVGAVTSIEFVNDLSVSEVEVTLEIEAQYANRIREDSWAWLQSQGLLGDMAIHIKMGTTEKDVVPAGAILPYKERSIVDELVGEDIRSGTADLLETTIAMLKEINRGQGTVGQLLKNPELYKNLNEFVVSLEVTTHQLQQATKEFEEIVQEVRSQKGTLGKLVFSEEYARHFTKLLEDSSGLLTSAREIVDGVRGGRGAVGKLFNDSELHDRGVKALDDVSRLASRMDAILEEAERSRSPVGRMLTDSETGRVFSETLARLDSTTGSLEKILGAIERGEGSVGMLVRDPSIAASLRDIFLGVKDMGLVQNLVRNAEQTGREAYLRDVDLTRLGDAEVRRARAFARIRAEGGAHEPNESATDGKAVPTAHREGEKQKENTSVVPESAPAPSPGPAPIPDTSAEDGRSEGR